MSNVYQGEDALRSFLDPHNYVTPLVELPKKLNPFIGDGVRIFLKLETFLPLGNVKSISAWGMLSQTLGQNHNIHSLVESSSGNTAYSLAVLSKIFGVKTMKAWVSNEITPAKLQLLQLFGIDVSVNQEQICPNPKDLQSGIYKAKSDGLSNGWMNLGQYDNDANPGIHYSLTGPQIWNQMQEVEGDFKVFSVGLGTTGSGLGISQFLKEKKSDLFSLGVVRKPNNPIPGPRTEHLLSEISFNWQDRIDSLEAVGTKQAYEQSLELMRNGIVVGPSSGMALQGLFSYLTALKKLDKLRYPFNAVVLCPDGPYLYIDEYFKYCDASLFPVVENRELLLDSVNFSPSLQEGLSVLNPIDCFSVLYGKKYIEKSEGLNKISSISLLENVFLVDMRKPSEFQHVHLYGSNNIPFDELSVKHFTPYFDKKIVLVCNYGKQSAFWASKLSQLGFSVYSLGGGIVSWSDAGLPREKNVSCKY